MKICLAMTLYNESSIIESALDSALANTKYECDVHVYLSGSRFFEKNLEELRDIQANKNYKLFISAGNANGDVVNRPSVGAARTMHNAYYKLGYDIVIAGSPDFSFTDRKGFDNFVDNAIEHLDNKYMISGMPLDDVGDFRFGFVIYTKKALENVGYIDPNFIPMGLSDGDYHRRCLISWSPDRDLSYYGSPDNFINPPYGTSIRIPAIHTAYTKNNLGVDFTSIFIKETADLFNMRYYAQKWGGLPGNEAGIVENSQYIHPFNDPNNSIKINYEEAISMKPPFEEMFAVI